MFIELSFSCREGQGTYIWSSMYSQAVVVLPASTAYQSLFSGVKRPGRETDHSHHLGLRVRMSGALPPLPYVP